MDHPSLDTQNSWKQYWLGRFIGRRASANIIISFIRATVSYSSLNPKPSTCRVLSEWSHIIMYEHCSPSPRPIPSHRRIRFLNLHLVYYWLDLSENPEYYTRSGSRHFIFIRRELHRRCIWWRQYFGHCAHWNRRDRPQSENRGCKSGGGMASESLCACLCRCRRTQNRRSRFWPKVRRILRFEELSR